MTKPQFGRSWVTMGVFLGAIGVMAGACSKAEDSGTGDDATGGTGSGSTSATGSTTVGGNKTSTGKTSTTASTTGGAATSTTTVSTGPVAACEGIVTTKEAVGDATSGVCNGAAVESEPFPTDMVILMDKSVSNTYTVEGTGMTRWEVLTAGMEALATAPEAANIGASITFFSVDGTVTEKCDPASYQTPVVPFGMLSTTGPQIVAKMKELKPGGLTPTVPALQGALTYAMQLKAGDTEREKVVVLMSDGFPTQCEGLTSPSDISEVISEAAAAPDYPVRTFIIGIGDSEQITSARFNLINYARSGNTGAPILINETADAEGIKKQVVDALLNISKNPLACEYDVKPPSDSQLVDPTKMTVTFEPASGNFQELPRVTGLSGCTKSTNGGFYLDDPTNPTKVTVCPCNCAAFGAGKVNLVYGCKPKVILE